MSNPNDEQLNRLLQTADSAFTESIALPKATSVNLPDIRRRAERGREARWARQKSLAGLAVACMMLGGWMWLAPSNEQNIKQVVVGEKIDVEQIQIELAACRKTQADLDEQLALLRLEKRLSRLQRELKETAEFSGSAELTYFRNRDSRVALEHIVDGRKDELSSSDLRKLRVLIVGFPETTAGSEARSLLAKHNKQH